MIMRHEEVRRDDTVGTLSALVEKQMGMLARYDDLVARLSRREAPASDQAMEKALGLLDQAIAKAERLTQQNRSMEEQLNRTIDLLEASLRNQEALASSRAGVGTESLEDALTKYDRMLERSLAALEDAYRATETSKQEVAERDRLLARTLDLLQAAVEGEQGPRKQGVIARLFA